MTAGLRGDARLVVGNADTSRAFGAGDVDVLATARLLGLCEQACLRALDGLLDPDTTSVNMRVQIDHLQPTPVGAEVVAEATLEKIEGRRLMFTVSASDKGGLVAAGKVTRVVLGVERFMNKCCEAS